MSNKIDTIQKRSKVSESINSIGGKFKLFFTDDEEYRTMFGLTDKGLDLVNESYYLASKYDIIRLSHRNINDDAFMQWGMSGGELNYPIYICLLILLYVRNFQNSVVEISNVHIF